MQEEITSLPTPLANTRPGSGYVAIKRAFDILVALLVIVGTLPFLPLIALAIKLDSPGPVFYTQDRVGLNGRIFTILKFRSMQDSAEELGPQWAAVMDKRITRLGRMMRRFHLDEFPQLINILRGEMSIVGPRPEIPAIVDELGREMPDFAARHAVKPGAAGWALIMQGYADSKAAAREKLEYDLYYIENASLLLDFKIMVRTIWFVLAGKSTR